jgi:amino acid adenylation domain-containing protein
MSFRNGLTGDAKGVDLDPSVRHDQESFFKQLLGDVEEPNVPFGLQDAEDATGNDEARLEVDKTLAVRLRIGANARGLSTASLFHLAWALVLAKTSGREDVVFGTVLYRSGAGAGGVKEPLANTLPMRIHIGEASVEEGLMRVHVLLENLRLHEDASLALAQRCSAVPPSLPLFSALLNYSDQSSQDHGMRGAPALEDLQPPRGEWGEGYPFTVAVNDLGDGFRLIAQAPASIGAMRVCRLMDTALASLIEALETRPSAPIRTLTVLPEAERHQVIYGWNETHSEFAADKCIHELFEEQVRKVPHAIAVVHEDNHLSYAELNRKANRLAHHLRALGVKPDVRVALCAERGFDMIVAVLAILKAGGAYVPLDPAYPLERLHFMLQDSAPLALLTQGHLARRFSGFSQTPPVIHIDATPAPWHHYPDTNPTCESIGLSSTHLAYVIYTSGSTGTPKGVLCEHRGLCNLAIAQIRDFGVQPDSRVLQFASFSFDACVSEIMMTLCRGAALYFGPRNTLLVGDTLTEVLAQYGITHVTLPPAVLHGMSEQTGLESLRTLILAGEALTEVLANRWAQNRRLINAYGPTESTVCAALYDYPAGASGTPPIGRPIANTQIYILDAQKEPAPIGVAGEIYIGGVGVARGYLNRADLNAQRFIPDPFAANPGARMYRTGDLGLWRPDGNIEFLGRNDFQVKIRGFRIELGEIESRLAEHPGVRQAVVVAREDTPGEKRLVAYYTAAEIGDSARDLDTEALRSHLSATLPEYMAPAAYVRLQSLPLTVNGKLDRKALPPPGGHAFTSRRHEPPIGETETALAEIWGELLKLDRIGRQDNFFDLGGHSLLAARMVARVRASFGTRLPLFSFIQTPTIAYLADLLAGNAMQMAVVNKGLSKAIPLIWVAPEAWLPRLTSYLSADQPVLSFVPSQEELESATPDYKLEDLAACTVTKILESCPRSEYMIAGFCNTSALAYECAQQLRQLGYQVPLLIMGDALLPGYLQGLPMVERSKRRLDRELFYLSTLRQAPLSHWRKLFSLRMGGLRARRGQAMWEKYYRSNSKSTELVLELYQALGLAQLRYVPSPYDGRVLYLQSGDRPQSSRWDAAATWQGLIDDLEVFEAPGDHTRIFDEPCVRAVAERLQFAIDGVADDMIFSPQYSGQNGNALSGAGR